MFLLIFNEQRVPKITFVLVLTYYVKPHLFVILAAIGWFIVNIQSDLFSHRCLERQAFGTPRMYTLSPSKSIKRSNYREFLKDKNVLLIYTTVLSAYKYAPNLESLLTQQYVCVKCTLWSDNTRFYSVKNANTQLIWSSGCPSLLLLFNMDLPQWPSMKSYVILEVFGIEIVQIIFSRFAESEVNTIFTVRPILSGRSEKGKQTIF